MTKTDKVLLIAIGGLLAYEVYTLVNETPDDTESEAIWRALPRRPIIPFALGFLLGHFVWQSQDVYDKILKDELKVGQVSLVSDAVGNVSISAPVETK